jgi:hypothetical protein
MTTTKAASIEKRYTVMMSSGDDALQTEEHTHTESEIINRAETILAKQMGQDLASFANLQVNLKNIGESDIAYYVDKSGQTVDFTKAMQFKAAIAVLNSQDQHFTATPV